MGCGCGGASNRYDGKATERAGRVNERDKPAVPLTGLPKVWTGRPSSAGTVNGPKPR